MTAWSLGRSDALRPSDVVRCGEARRGEARWGGGWRYTEAMEATGLRALLAMSLSRGWGPRTILACWERWGLDACGALGRAELEALEGVGAGRAAGLAQSLAATLAGDAVDRELARAQELGVRLLVWGEEGYPAGLKHIHDPPPVLYVRGELRPGDALALAIVGSRRCSAYGREQADRFASFAAGAGLCVVSGGAMGIDGAAHEGALRAGGRTVAVLGSGLAQPYPAEHGPLFDRIASPGRGAVVSELPMDTPPRAENFPRRNRLVSGLALGVLVVEAAKRSGALITARVAAEEHGREVMAVPGRVDAPGSEGCHRIIREGWGALVTCGQDVLDTLGEAAALLNTEPRTLFDGLASEGDEPEGDEPGGREAGPGVKASGAGAGPPSAPRSSLLAATMTQTQRKLVECLGRAASLDELLAASGMEAQVVQAELTLLELRGVVKRERGVYRLR